jgi:CheY-like chemotaxis protein
MAQRPFEILLVEDDQPYRYALAQRLREAGLAVAETAGFTEALALLDGPRRFDLLVTDILMQVHGFAMARMARRSRPELRIVYVTGREHVPSEELATAYGPVLAKSAGIEQVAAEIARLRGAAPLPSLATVPGEDPLDRQPSPHAQAIDELEQRLREGRRMLEQAQRGLARAQQLIAQGREEAPPRD